VSEPVPVVCSIGCTDPWNAAGLGLDVRALADCGVRPVSVVAGVSAQDAGGLRAAAAIAPGLIAAQFEALTGAAVAAYRIGALLDPESVAAVARALRGALVPVVYDPVLGPSGGGAFADDATLAAIRERLLPQVTIVTPNLAEAARLTGEALPADRSAMERAGRDLLDLGAGAALVTGGHLPGDPIDLLVERGGALAFAGTRLAGTLRGTGCLLACALAAELARGATLPAAVERGRAFVRERFSRAQTVGGMRLAY
jgi:hydroxymethylpyrimidine/phosphomethylpyrimidine kinase